jgi:beta-N-acetylglucosaminidase
VAGKRWAQRKRTIIAKNLPNKQQSVTLNTSFANNPQIKAKKLKWRTTRKMQIKEYLNPHTKHEKKSQFCLCTGLEELSDICSFFILFLCLLFDVSWR